MNIQILYGIEENNINVGPICLKKCLYNNIICIPKTDNARALLFTDPLVGTLKSIFIKNELTGTLEKFTHDKIIYIDLIDNIVYTSLNFQKPFDRLHKIHNNLKIDFGDINHEYQEQLMSSIFLTGNEKILEIGSNIGRNSLVIASILNSSNNSDFVTLECDEGIYNQLIHNKNLNTLSFFAENSALSKRQLIQEGWNTIPSDELLPGYHRVNTIDYSGLISKYGIQFDTLVLDCEGAFYYILLDMPEILDNINLILLENDFVLAEEKIYVDSVLKKRGFNVIYLVDGCGGWGYCENNFWEVWLKSSV
jgi:FkbM family methyltransferase